MSKSSMNLLLSLDKSKIKRPTKQLEIKRLSELAGEPIVFTCQALTMEEFQEVQEVSISYSKRGELEDISTNNVQIFAVLKGVVDPSLKDAKLMEMYGASTPKQLLAESKLLLPGEISQLYNAISSLSGFGDDAVAELKNG